jgi:alpha-beta hydrolase superfamily lysophospholipase
MKLSSTPESYVHEWMIDNPKAIVLIVHGMSEHGERYSHFGAALNKEGYGVYCPDLRGHGKTAGDLDNVGFFADRDGWNVIVNETIRQTQEIKSLHPNVPVFILGHSMGSFISRTIAFTEPSLVDGYILSATIKHPGWKGYVGKPLAKTCGFFFGKKKRMKFLTNTSFAGFNKRIENKRTEKDWLTRDAAIVDQYIADPYCMQDFTNQFFYDLATGVLGMCKQSNIAKISIETPVLITAGSMDPAGQYGKGPKVTCEHYKKAGAKDLELKLFEAGRHEIINETNRDEVYAYLFSWLNDRCK